MKIGFALLGFGACIGAAIATHHFWEKPPAQIAGGVDLSPSMKRNCSGLVSAVKRAIEQADIQDGSTFTLLGLGFSGLNSEPERLLDEPLPVELDTVFGQDRKDFDQKREGFFASLKDACDAAPASKDSPILRLVTRSIAHLRSRGCTAQAICLVIVETDLEEDSDPDLRAAIQRAIGNPAAGLPKSLTGSIDNVGIGVAICGASEVAERRSGKHANPETLARLWIGLFTHPELVSIEPYCGQ